MEPWYSNKNALFSSKNVRWLMLNLFQVLLLVDWSFYDSNMVKSTNKRVSTPSKKCLNGPCEIHVLPQACPEMKRLKCRFCWEMFDDSIPLIFLDM